MTYDPGQQQWSPQPTQQVQPQQYPPQPARRSEPPPGPARGKSSKWPWIIAGVAVLVMFGSCTANARNNSGGDPTTSVAAPTTTPAPASLIAPTAAAEPAEPTSTEPPVVDVVLPKVAGENGAIVYDELDQLGLTNVSYASRDAEDTVVLYPANWTAVKIEPAAGTTVKSNSTVVVTMTKKR